jgi:CBS domain-containing membrane protein
MDLEKPVVDIAVASKMLGIELSPVSHRERLVSALGGFVGIFAVYWISRAVLGAAASPIMVLSMGSTAAMLFAVPHGALSQPWPLLGGHLVSGLIGIACLLYVPDPLLAGKPCHGTGDRRHALPALHPSSRRGDRAGGRTGQRIVKAMGFGFVAAPLMLNVLIILTAAIAFNALFPWRRYPAALVRNTPAPTPAVAATRRDLARRLRLRPVADGLLHRHFRGRPAAHLQPGDGPPPRGHGAGGGRAGQPFWADLNLEKSDLV